jgi:hypothetical protein
MNNNRLIALSAIVAAIFIIASCSVAPHPNEKIIVGTWIPSSIEKIVDSSALQAAANMSGGNEQKSSKPGAPSGDGGAVKKAAALDRLVQSEQRATMEIFADKKAVKNYPGKPVHLTWKMKGKGTRIVAKNLENGTTVVIDILEITKEQVVIIEHTQVGDIKITYERQQ